MPRIRTIKPEFWADEKLSPLRAIDRLVFLGLISMADDCGRLLDSPRSIDGFIFPSSRESSRRSLETLAELGRIERGVTASGQAIIQIRNWTTHQKIDRPNTLTALPPLAEQKLPPKLSRRVAAAKAKRTVDHPAPFDEASSSRSTIYDQGPTTNDQRPPSESGSGNAFEGELGDPVPRALVLFAAEWFRQHGTTLDVSKNEGAIRGVIDRIGVDEAIGRWRGYLVSTDLRFASVRAFAQKHPAFAAAADGRRPFVDRRAAHLAASDAPLEVEFV